MTTHHDLDISPIPEKVLYVNDLALADGVMPLIEHEVEEPRELLEAQQAADNVRVYVPIDINEDSLLRMLKNVIDHYQESSEANEFDFSWAVSAVLTRLEIYDQVWSVREGDADRKHSKKAEQVMRKFIQMLEEIPDACAEQFPFELIDELRLEYGFEPREF